MDMGMDMYNAQAGLDQSDYTIIGPYKAQGMNSRIYITRQKSTGTRCISKVIDISTKLKREEFDRETRLYRIASDAGLSPLLIDVLRKDCLGFLITREVQGLRLDAFSTSTEGTLTLMSRVVTCLLQETGIIHFDNRAENFMVQTKPAYKVHVLDYGNSVHTSSLSRRERDRKLEALTVMHRGQVAPVVIPEDIYTK